ncbi:MAG: endonuclease III domain-containing protein [Candidatus Omnitrophota bacterium]|nr:endonuclease III domain-containing protein [Candidatus Omnitrophota bacterium]
MKKKLIGVYNALYGHFGPQYWWPARTKFEIITGAILTQNTAWPNVEKAIKNLAGQKLLNPVAIKNIKKKKLAILIKPSGYYNIKAGRLKNFVNFLFKKYNGSIKKMFRENTESLRKELLDVKGLGRETADSILLYAGKKPIFVIDAYTRRILSRHHIIHDSSDYDSVQRLFMDNLPLQEPLFGEYHALLVKLAKDICKSKPECLACPVRKMF